jgi:hypothetical protein
MNSGFEIESLLLFLALTKALDAEKQKTIQSRGQGPGPV